MSHPSDKGNNPARLSGLRQAMYILDCLQDGTSEDQIVKNCDGDSEMVKVWMDFLTENHWVSKDASNRLILTDKGRQQMASYYRI